MGSNAPRHPRASILGAFRLNKGSSNDQLTAVLSDTSFFSPGSWASVSPLGHFVHQELLERRTTQASNVLSQTLCSDVRSTSWKGAGSILQLLKLTCSSSCISSHSAICKTMPKREGNEKKYSFRLDTHPKSRLASRFCAQNHEAARGASSKHTPGKEPGLL